MLKKLVLLVDISILTSFYLPYLFFYIFVIQIYLGRRGTTQVSQKLYHKIYFIPYHKKTCL